MAGVCGNPREGNRPLGPSLPRIVILTFLASVLICPVVSAGLGCIPVPKWSWSPPLPSGDYSNQVVARFTDTNGDGKVNASDVPNLVYARCADCSRNAFVLSVLDGRTGVEVLTTILPPSDPELYPASAIADLDGDGFPELIALSRRNRIIVFDRTGRVTLTGDVLPRTFSLFDSIGVADLDQDGSPEIFVGSMVLDAKGKLKWLGSLGEGANAVFSRVSNAVDLVPASPGLELVAGHTVYDARGLVLWTRNELPDGRTAIGDIDGDRRPEVVLVGQFDFWVLDGASGKTLVQQPVPGSRNGWLAQPILADLDGDGVADIVVSQDDKIEAFRWKLVSGNPSLERMWVQPNQDYSRGCAPAAFDFDQDGAFEVVNHDEAGWSVLDGATGATLWWEPLRSGTIFQTPLIVDVDGDCTTDIIVSGQLIPFTPPTVSAFACDSPGVARSIWNQYGYHVTNVADDATIPKSEKPPWECGIGWLAQVGPPRAIAAALAPAAACPGTPVTLDASPSPGCLPGGIEYRWLDGATVLCDWALSPICVVRPSAPATYTLEVRYAGVSCAPVDSKSKLVSVLPDPIPGDQGNVLRAVKRTLDVELDFGGALATFWRLYRDIDKRALGMTALAPDATVVSFTDPRAVPPPETLWCYRLKGLSPCSLTPGP